MSRQSLDRRASHACADLAAKRQSCFKPMERWQDKSRDVRTSFRVDKINKVNDLSRGAQAPCEVRFSVRRCFVEAMCTSPERFGR
jgi:hypothetical protein